MSGALHMPLGSAWACIKVLRYEFFGHIGAPFEETFPRCFQQCGYLGITQRLMCKFDGVGLHLHQVREVREVDTRVVAGCHCGMVGGTIFTGAWLWQETLSWGGPHLPVWNR